MGNIDSRAKFDGGYIYLQTDKPYYYPGNTVYGKIYIRTDVPMEPSHIDIYVKGKEKADYDRAEEQTKVDPNKIMSHKSCYSKKIIHFKGTCFNF